MVLKRDPANSSTKQKDNNDGGDEVVLIDIYDTASSDVCGIY